MSQVNVVINSRQYRMACEDGQEERLLELARDLDQRILQLRDKFGEIGDTRLTVMAALTIADELSEAGQQMQGLERELTALRDARTAFADRSKMTHAAIVAAFNSAAERIENLTRRLNQSLGDGIAIG
jgi:cell division protein ZapA